MKDPQLNRKQAQALYDSGVWQQWTDAQVVRFQFYQTRLSLPISRFKEALSNLLGKPVFTHDLESDELEIAVRPLVADIPYPIES